MFHFTDGGLTNIWLANGYEEVDTPYGKAVSFHDLDGLIKAICIALAEKDTALKGAEFRYLRQALGLSQGAIGQLTHHANDNEAIKNLLSALNVTERTLHFVMRKTPRGWRDTEQTEQPTSADA